MKLRVIKVIHIKKEHSYFFNVANLPLEKVNMLIEFKERERADRRETERETLMCERNIN